MAEAEDPYRVIAKAYEKMGNKEESQRYLELAKEKGEAAGGEYDEEQKKIDAEISRILNNLFKGVEARRRGDREEGKGIRYNLSEDVKDLSREFINRLHRVLEAEVDRISKKVIFYKTNLDKLDISYIERFPKGLPVYILGEKNVVSIEKGSKEEKKLKEWLSSPRCPLPLPIIFLR